jgi:pyruvate/2-oxoglutarate dehydrogenase complex dihydrolipoamide dehydrogenase (E3) component
VILGGAPDQQLVPFSLFTDPELPRVGLSEKETKAQGIAYRLFKI